MTRHEVKTRPPEWRAVACRAELAECHAAGYADWRLYAMTEVVTDG